MKSLKRTEPQDCFTPFIWSKILPGASYASMNFKLCYQIFFGKICLAHEYEAPVEKNGGQKTRDTVILRVVHVFSWHFRFFKCDRKRNSKQNDNSLTHLKKEFFVYRVRFCVGK